MAPLLHAEGPFSFSAGVDRWETTCHDGRTWSIFVDVSVSFDAEDRPLLWYEYVALVAAGLVAGFINTLAGSGSLVTLPALMFIGHLPAPIANGTNRIGLVLQNVVAVGSFRSQNVMDLKGGLWLACPATVGAIIGALIAVDLDEETMHRVIGGLMAVMLVVILVRPTRWIRPATEVEQSTRRPGWKSLVLFFLVGIYGGFLQAGIGVFMLASLVLGAGYDLVRANAVKVLIILCYTPLALAVFVSRGQVDWTLGLVLASGNMVGAWIAARTAVRRGAGFVRWLLIGVVAVAGAKLLGLFTLLQTVVSP